MIFLQFLAVKYGPGSFTSAKQDFSFFSRRFFPFLRCATLLAGGKTTFNLVADGFGEYLEGYSLYLSMFYYWVVSTVKIL